MYIHSLHMQNFRAFRDAQIVFTPGVNVIIGENNGGKTSLLRALGLIFDRRRSNKLGRYDFYQGINDYSVAPSIRVTVTLKSSSPEETDTPDDKSLVATWLTKPGESWEATLTYFFHLPDNDAKEFELALSKRPAKVAEKEYFWDVVDRFLPKYIARIYAGDFSSRNRAEPEYLSKFDYQFLDAIRDAESELFSGANPLLRSMLRQILDDPDVVSEADRARYVQDFKERATALLEDNLKPRLNIDKLFSLATETGARDGGNPILGGTLTESELIAALQLLIEREYSRLPVNHNGLGYNNLLYISLVLASLNHEADRKTQGQNAVIFPMLVIEEPEAHLHPALQYKLVKHIRKQQEATKSGSRQVFITTHSTHVTSASRLDDIICMTTKDNGEARAAYPGEVFSDDKEGQKSKMYVERYLDATKSSMLFAKAVVLVEGIAEQLLVPCFAEYKDKPFEENHVVTVAVGGLNFKHFMPIFGAGLSSEKQALLALNRPVACIIDADPQRKKTKGKKTRFKKCYPYQIDLDLTEFDYKSQSGALSNLQAQCKDTPNIGIYSSLKTFEYDLALENPHCELIVTDYGTYSDSLREYADTATLPDDLEELLIDNALYDDLHQISDKNMLSKCMFATCYLLTLEKAKGEHAFELNYQLRVKLEEKASQAKKDFHVPNYIGEAIDWVIGV